jgi:hypothetical protein
MAKAGRQLQASTTARGLGHAHRELRLRLLPLAYGTACPLCGETMVKRADCRCNGRGCFYCTLDLDHEIPRVLGLAASGRGRKRIAHRYCNRAAGARLGNRRRAAIRRRMVHSRVW